MYLSFLDIQGPVGELEPARTIGDPLVTFNLVFFLYMYIFWETKAWHYIWIVCLGDNSHENQTIFSLKNKKKKVTNKNVVYSKLNGASTCPTAVTLFPGRKWWTSGNSGNFWWWCSSRALKKYSRAMPKLIKCIFKAILNTSNRYQYSLFLDEN